MTRVLILDDDPVILTLLARQFQLLGANVVACREIEAAEAVIDTLPVDKVLADLCISAFGGLEGTRLLRHAAAEHPAAELYAMSAHLDEKVCDILAALGVVESIPKPFHPGEIARRVLAGRQDVAPALSPRPGEVHLVDGFSSFLSSGRLHALLQPVVGIRRGATPHPIHGYEGFASAPADCLLRNPALLFDLAARKDKLVQTDLLCVRATLAESVRLGRGHRLFINVHPRSLAHPDFVRGFEDAVAEAGVSPSDVVLELSEQQATLGQGDLAEGLAGLRKSGFKASLDNFGDGTSNLKLLLDLKPDYVKLSGWLTEGMDVDPAKREVLRSTRDLLGRLGMRAILARIETATQLETALDLGFELGQGWHFSRPMRADDLKSGGAFSGPAHGKGSFVPASPFAVPSA